MVCCGQLQSPVENGIQSLEMHRQPTPCAEPLRKGHFLKHCDGLKELGANLKLHNDFMACHLTAHCITSNKNMNKKQDIDVGRVVKSWDAKRVRTIIQCFHCRKAHCIYTVIGGVYSIAMVALQQKIEFVFYILLVMRTFCLTTVIICVNKKQGIGVGRVVKG